MHCSFKICCSTRIFVSKQPPPNSVEVKSSGIKRQSSTVLWKVRRFEVVLAQAGWWLCGTWDRLHRHTSPHWRPRPPPRGSLVFFSFLCFYNYSFFFLLEYSWHTILASGVQHSDLTFVYLHDTSSNHLSPYKYLRSFWLCSLSCFCFSLHKRVWWSGLEVEHVLLLAPLVPTSLACKGFIFHLDPVTGLEKECGG